jgi:4'-phosphopantetheinyl transferase EntD
MFGETVSVAASPITANWEDLLSAETATVSRAVDKRRREFATGRVLARSLLARLGFHGPVPREEDGTPRWPDGIVGSISHSNTLCVVAVARQAEVAAIGIDTEPVSGIPEELWPRICTPQELTQIAAVPDALRGLWVKAIFCAKEAAYKCQYPLTQRFLDFQEVETTRAGEFIHQAGLFRARLCPFAPSVEFKGSFTLVHGHFLAGIVLEAGSVPPALKEKSLK